MVVLEGIQLENIETKIKGFYDILSGEIEKLNHLHNLFIEESKIFGFQEIKTSMVELRKRYLNATLVHPSKIFEVYRLKEGSRHVLQADLAMSMSRFIADLPNKTVLKLVQDGTMFRDRPADLPGFRKSFNQILLGAWGTSSLWVDAEILAITWRGLSKIEGISTCFIQISNKGIFDAIRPGLSHDIRFSEEGIECLNQVNIANNDRRQLKKLFFLDRIPLVDAIKFFESIESPEIKREFNKIIQLRDFLLCLVPQCRLLFSLKNLSGTGHYSSLNYKAFIVFNSIGSLEIADGGRIDDMAFKLNGSQVPGVCMGIGNTVLAQLMDGNSKERKLALLVDDVYFNNNYQEVYAVATKCQTVNCSIIPIPWKKKKKVLKSSFYRSYDFILIDAEGTISVRSEESNNLTLQALIGDK